MILFSPNQLGKRGEKAAARFLHHEGYRIVGRNVHCGRNELDLVVKNREYLVFVEVKARSFATRAEAENARPAAAVNAEKRRRTLDAAFCYLRAHPCRLTPRADVVEVYFEKGSKKPYKIHHIPAAFDVRGCIR